jgi:hypothetical protein
MTETDIFRWRKRRFLLKCAALLMVGGASTALAVAFASEAGKKTEKRTTYGTGVETGFQFVRYHDTCILFQAFFVSGDFFSGLRQVDTPAGRQFEKKQASIQNFSGQHHC